MHCKFYSRQNKTGAPSIIAYGDKLYCFSQPLITQAHDGEDFFQTTIIDLASSPFSAENTLIAHSQIDEKLRNNLLSDATASASSAPTDAVVNTVPSQEILKTIADNQALIRFTENAKTNIRDPQFRALCERLIHHSIECVYPEAQPIKLERLLYHLCYYLSHYKLSAADGSKQFGHLVLREALKNNQSTAFQTAFARVIQQVDPIIADRKILRTQLKGLFDEQPDLFATLHNIIVEPTLNQDSLNHAFWHVITATSSAAINTQLEFFSAHFQSAALQSATIYASDKLKQHRVFRIITDKYRKKISYPRLDLIENVHTQLNAEPFNQMRINMALKELALDIAQHQKTKSRRRRGRREHPQPFHELLLEKLLLENLRSEELFEAARFVEISLERTNGCRSGSPALFTDQPPPRVEEVASRDSSIPLPRSG